LFDEGIKVENLRIFMHFSCVVYLRQTNNAIKADRVHATLYPVSHLVGQSVGRYDLSTFKFLKNEGKSKV